MRRAGMGPWFLVGISGWSLMFALNGSGVVLLITLGLPWCAYLARLRLSRMTADLPSLRAEVDRLAAVLAEARAAEDLASRVTSKAISDWITASGRLREAEAQARRERLVPV